jgi:hypothetical protein
MLGGTFSGMSTGNRGYGEGVLWWENNPYNLPEQTVNQMNGRKEQDWGSADYYRGDDNIISGTKGTGGILFDIDQSGNFIPNKRFYWVNNYQIQTGNGISRRSGTYLWQKPVIRNWTSSVTKNGAGTNTFSQSALNTLRNLLNTSIKQPYIEFYYFNDNQSQQAWDLWRFVQKQFQNVYFPMPRRLENPVDPGDSPNLIEVNIEIFTW